MSTHALSSLRKLCLPCNLPCPDPGQGRKKGRGRTKPVGGQEHLHERGEGKEGGGEGRRESYHSAYSKS